MSDETRDAARDEQSEKERRWQAYLHFPYRDRSDYRAFLEGYSAGADWASSRTCVWKWNEAMMWFDSGCGSGYPPEPYDRDHYPPQPQFDYCPACGGKIVEEG